MKRSFWLLSLLLLLSACILRSSNAQCQDGICISINVENPVQAQVPARFILTVTTDKDINDLSIGLSAFPGITVSDVEQFPENAALIYQDETMLDWQIQAKGGQEYVFSGHILLAKPTVSYGVFSYTLLAFFSRPAVGRVTASTTITLDAAGNQVDAGRAKREWENEIPVAPTPPPDLTVVPETPISSEKGGQEINHEVH